MTSDTNTMGLNRLTRRGFVASVTLLAAIALAGCGSHEKPADVKPVFNPGEGAIDGEIIGTDKEPFDVELAGGDKQIKIELLSPVSGVAATTVPSGKKPHFAFNHIPPGRYELTVYVTVTGKRSIAGNLPVVVDPDQISPAKLTLTVTPADGSN